MKVKMLKIDTAKLSAAGFDYFGDGWFRKKIPQNFRGEYTLYISANDIYGIFQGMSIQELELKDFIDKLAFRSPQSAEAVKKMLVDLKACGAIDYEEVEV